MGKGLPRSMSRGAPQRQEIIKEIIPVKNVQIVVTGGAATAAGFGTVPIGGFPEGQVFFIGALAYMSFAGSGSDANLSPTWAGAFSIGSAATVDATLSGTDADITGSATISAAVAEVTTRIIGRGATQGIFDNTNGTLRINLNLITNDNDVTDGATSTLTVNGELHIAYIMFGDD